MRPIDQNLQYDFNFQQFTVLPNEVTVLPVSSIIIILMMTKIVARIKYSSCQLTHIIVQ